MKHSESVKELAVALVKAQAAIQSVVKDKTGKIETKSGAKYEYNYSDLSSVIDAVKGPLNEAGITFIQCPSAEGKVVTVTTVFLHTSGEWLESSISMPVGQDTAQAYGSAITYGKRYALQSMTGLPSADDDGKEASKPAAPRPNTATQVAVDAFDGMNDEEKDFLRSTEADIKGLFAAKGDVVAYFDSHKLDTEEKLALWSLLPSDVRSWIKKSQAAKPFTAADYASQA